MASYESATIQKIPKVDQDLISNLPTDLMDNILKFLPLQSVARTSVLSEKWRQNWLSHRYLVFDQEFWEGQRTNREISWQKISNIISNILFHHIGPIHEFNLYIPWDVDQVIDLNLSQWLSFLSRSGIKKISLENRHVSMSMPSHIFTCTDLDELLIKYCHLTHLPTDFKGFACLRSLRLTVTEFQFQHADTIERLLANCPRLKTLLLKCNTPGSLLNVDVPGLEHLTIVGNIESFAFKDAPHLKSISLHLYQHNKSTSNEKIIRIANFLLASSSELQSLKFNGDLCELFASSNTMKRWKRFNLAFCHLVTLCLEDIDLDDFGVFCFTIGMIEISPFIEDLKISVSSEGSVDVQHKYNFNGDYKLGNLRTAVIKNIEGTWPELKFIHYLLSISVVLEKLVLNCSNVDPSSMLEVSQILLEFPRASTKAEIICLEQEDVGTA